MNIASALFAAAEAHPSQRAVVRGEDVLTYAELRDRAGRVAAGLAALGVEPGDRVALLLPNTVTFLEALFGTLAAGAAVVPVNTRLHPKEYDYILEHAGAKALLYDGRFADGLASVDLASLGVTAIADGDPAAALTVDALRSGHAPLAAPVARAADDLAWLFSTSGTTGRPKGAMVTHGNLEFMCDRYDAEVFDAGPGDRALHAGPLTHGSGLWAIPLARAASTHVLPPSGGFDPGETFRLIEEHRVTKLVFLAPTMIRMLLEAPESATADCSSLRFLGYGGAPIHPDDLAAARERWGPILCNIYGQGECPMTITMLSPADHARAFAERPEHLRTVGRARGEIDVAVCDERGTPLPAGEIGEVCVNGPIVMRGYWNDPEATAEAFRDGWYHTGDLGRFDDAGYLTLLDRTKELIISGGANIYPREVEAVIALHPAVREVAVFGMPDRHWGESVVAAVVPAGGLPVSADELIELCRENLASYKKPRHIWTVDQLPRNATGKVLRRELAEQFARER